MTEPYLSESTSFTLEAGVWLSCGALIGALHFLSLKWSVRLFVAGGASLLPMILQLGRLAFVACMLAVIAGRFGAGPLLTATLGILVARTSALCMGERE